MWGGGGGGGNDASTNYAKKLNVNKPLRLNAVCSVFSSDNSNSVWKTLFSKDCSLDSFTDLDLSNKYSLLNY